MPGWNDRGAPSQLPGADDASAQHRRLSPAQHAQGAGACGSKAKYPAIDYHGHPTSQLSTAEGLEQLGDALDALNVRVMVAANNVSGEQLKRQVALVKGSARMKDACAS
jgi:hypothetical protein